MPQIARILVPTDFSECSKAALKHAGVWARQFGATIDLMHVWQAPVFAHGGLAEPGFADDSVVELVRKQSEQALLSLAAEARDSGIPVRVTRSMPGTPAATIAAESGAYDLLVTGTHGRTGVRHFLLGSVAERIVQLAKCPVVTVRAPE